MEEVAEEDNTLNGFEIYWEHSSAQLFLAAVCRIKIFLMIGFLFLKLLKVYFHIKSEYWKLIKYTYSLNVQYYGQTLNVP